MLLLENVADPIKTRGLQTMWTRGRKLTSWYRPLQPQRVRSHRKLLGSDNYYGLFQLEPVYLEPCNAAALACWTLTNHRHCGVRFCFISRL